MPGFVRLNAGDHPLEHVVTRFASERRQSNELQIRETGFEHNVGGDVELNRVLSKRQFIEEVSRGNREPVVGVVKLVRPIELGV
jgi:hypothetical protein